jgi:ABC-type phosphate/phosphonate transport system substrate-binding protein
VTVFELAKVMGTSVRMIERHYGALLDGAHAAITGRLDALEAELEQATEKGGSLVYEYDQCLAWSSVPQCISFADSKGRLTTYKAGIWVPADSTIRSIADLKGHSLALSEPRS